MIAVAVRVVLSVVSFVDFLLATDDFLPLELQIGVFSDREILVLLDDYALFVHGLWLLFLLPFELFALPF